MPQRPEKRVKTKSSRRSPGKYRGAKPERSSRRKGKQPLLLRLLMVVEAKVSLPDAR